MVVAKRVWLKLPPLRYLFGILQCWRRATGDHGRGVFGAGVLGEPDKEDHTPVLVGQLVGARRSSSGGGRAFANLNDEG